MREPKRKSEILRATKQGEEDQYLTPAAIKRLKEELERLEKKDRPDMIKEVQRTAEMGDFSENFAYQQAKHHLRRMNNRMIMIEEKLKYAIPIRQGSDDGQIRIGSTVTVEANGKELTFEIVGSQETNPTRGRISFVSPLGKLLIGKKIGESVVLRTGDREVVYAIRRVC